MSEAAFADEPPALAGEAPRPASRFGRLSRNAILLLAGALVLLLVVSQLALPGMGEGAIEDRLTANGGVADVSLSALPAARLLWGSGDRIEIDGRGLELELANRQRAFEALDRFGAVEIVLADTDAGPLSLESFILTRDGDAPYRLEATANASVADLARYGVETAELPGAGVVGTLLELTGIAGTDVPIELTMELASDDGRLRVLDDSSSVGGIPTGPLAELITATVAVQL